MCDRPSWILDHCSIYTLYGEKCIIKFNIHVDGPIYTYSATFRAALLRKVQSDSSALTMANGGELYQ